MSVCLVPCAYLGWGQDDNRIYSLPYFIMLLGGVASQNVHPCARNMVWLVTFRDDGAVPQVLARGLSLLILLVTF